MASLDPRIQGLGDSANGRIYDGVVRHAVLLERLKTHEANQVVAFLETELYGDLVETLTARLAHISARGFDAGPWTSKRLANMLQTVDGLITEGYRGSHKAFGESLVAISKSEAEWMASLLATASPVDLGISLPSPALLRSVVTARPFQGRLLREWYGDLAEETRRGVRQAVQLGITRGEGVEAIVRRIKGTRAAKYTDGVLEISRRHARTTVRTAVAHTTNHANEALYAENQDVIGGVQWSSTLDDRTTIQCASLDGQVFPIDEGPRPPIHHNALATGTQVLTGRGPRAIEDVRVGDSVWTHRARWMPVYAAMGRPSGPERMWRLQTASGRVVRITDEHPILTSLGWRRAEDLQVGDDVFEHFDEFSYRVPTSASVPTEQATLDDAHNGPPLPDEPSIPNLVFVSTRGMSAAVEFERHPGIREGEIHNIGADGVLERCLVPEHAAQHSLPGGRAVAERPSLGAGDLLTDPGVVGGVVATHGDGARGAISIEGFGIRSAIVGVASQRGALAVCLRRGCGLRAECDPVPPTCAIQCSRSQPEASFNRADRLASLPVVALNELGKPIPSPEVHAWHSTTIISIVEERDYGGMVWNLAVEEDETYLAEGVVVHNCRSRTLPYLKSWKELGIDLKEAPPGTRASMDGQVAASTTFPKWLRRQPIAVQEEVLGVTRAKLFREGMPIDRFIGRDLKPLTLAQIRAREGLPAS